MSAIVRSEFALALNQIAAERGISPEEVLETIKAAILAAYRKEYRVTDLENYRVEINPENGETKIFQKDKEVTPPGFGRIAAQTAKQVILQKIREAEKKAIIGDYRKRIGSLVNGMVLRFEGQNVIVDIGKAEAVMPPEEKVPNEFYRLNQRLTFYLKDIKEGVKGSQIIVSRKDENLIALLFKREVPEVQSGAVEIKYVVREAGSRTKIAVFSKQAGVDPVGACVGQKGVRVQTVIKELGGLEKIDIIQWNQDPLKFLAAALAPATGVEIKIEEKQKKAKVKVPEDQLSLAIGKDGQNVRLAAKLTGYKIDIVGDKKKDKKDEKKAKGEDKKEKEKKEKKTEEAKPPPSK